jgi:hypothetical protein
MSSSVLCTHPRAIRITLIWLILHPILYLLIMPVITRLQSRLYSLSTTSVNTFTEHSTSSSESLHVYSTSCHSTSSSYESLTGLLQPTLVTSSSVERSESIALQSTSVALSTSPSRPSKCYSDLSLCPLSSDCIQSSSMSSSVNISNLKFPNQSESVQFEILEFGSLGGFEANQSDFSNSHKFSISNSVTMDDDDGAEDHLRFVTSNHSRVTQKMQDMNNLFESIKHHITNATQQLSGDLQQVVDSNSKFKQEVQDELQEMRQFLAEQKRLLGLQSSSDVTMVPTISPVTLPSVSSVPSMQNVAPPVVPQSVQSSTLDSTHASQDINAQMLLLLTDSFSKYPQH